MEQATRDFILGILNHCKDLTLATMRPDGYPQATTVSFANDGLAIYVGVGKGSQKLDNIRHSNKVSLTVNKDYKDWNEIRGLSMAGTAEILEDDEDIRQASQCMVNRFPEVAEWTGAVSEGEAILLRITPQVISVLDYTKGFGHTDLVTV